jgi:serine/threonine-protein kinase
MKLLTLEELSSRIRECKEVELSFGRIQLQKQIGQGGNGIVYQCRLIGNDIDLAVKFLCSSGNKSETDQVERFFAEILNLRRLKDQKYLVTYINLDKIKFDQVGYVYAILMEKYDGSLVNYKTIERDEHTFLRFFNFLINSVSYLHQNNIIHRDLKPENILVKNDYFYLTDFGIASFQNAFELINHKTTKGERLGNRLFAAPEQQNGNVKAERTMDIFAIGQLLHWFVYGETHQGSKRKLVKSKLNDLDSVYDLIIDKCLQPDSSLRYNDLSEVVQYFNKEQRKKREEFKFNHYFEKFNKLIVSLFPKSNSTPFQIINKEIINKLIFRINEQRNDVFYDKLFIIWKQSRHMLIENEILFHDGCVCIEDLYMDIKQVWIHSNRGHFKTDFIILECCQQDPIEIDNELCYDYGIIGSHQKIVSYDELENGFFTNSNGDSVEIDYSELNRVVSRFQEPTLVFLSTNFHNLAYADMDLSKYLDSFSARYFKTNDRVELVIELSDKLRNYVRREQIGYDEYS